MSIPFSFSEVMEGLLEDEIVVLVAISYNEDEKLRGKEEKKWDRRNPSVTSNKDDFEPLRMKVSKAKTKTRFIETGDNDTIEFRWVEGNTL